MKKLIVAAIVMALVLALVVPLAAPAGAIPVEEVLYLSDSGGSQDGITTLFEVELDSGTGRANLTPLPAYDGSLLGPGVIPFNQVDALACSPDGTKLYAIDKYGGTPPGPYEGSGKLGIYDMSTDPPTWTESADEVKHGGAIVWGIVLAACSDDGTLYVASEDTESLYTVDTGTAVATLVGQIRTTTYAVDTEVNVAGADLIFAADGTLYLWTKDDNGANAPKGLYVLTLPASPPDTVWAEHKGEGPDRSFTGLAIREHGEGDLVGSTHQNEIFELSTANGSLIETYWMYKDGSPYEYQYGDMTVGALYENPVEVPVDIKPTSCPNPLNVKGKGVLPVAILGTVDFDVSDIDPATVLLEGVPPLRWALEDVATPYDGTPEDCLDCTTAGPDGFVDLTLKFDKQEVVDALEPVSDGEAKVLTLTGELFDGTEFEGQDVVCIIKKGKK